MTIGERIVFLREERGISQKELAQLLHITAATLSRYENDIYQPKLEFLCEMCRVLDTSSDFLLGFTMQYQPISDNASDFPLITAEEKDFLKHYNKLSVTNKARVHERMLVLLENQKK